MEPERFIERMLEIENLTDELEDADAQLLLDWGRGELGPLLANIQDVESAGEKANTLMAVMRKINRLSGRIAGKDAGMLAEELSALDELFITLYPSASIPSGQDVALDAARLAGLNTRAALEFIFQRQSQSKTSRTA